MDITIAKNAVTRIGGKGLLLVQRYSPEILTGVGIIGLIGSGIWAAKKTLDLPEITEELDLKREYANSHSEEDLDWAKEHHQAFIRKAHFEAGREVVKLYILPVGLGVVSTSCILAGFGILRARNAALTATVVSLSEALNSYRERVANKIGEDEERELWLGAETIVAPDEDGRPMALTTINPKDNPYGRWFDEGSTQFSREPGYNARILLTEQNYFNDRLKARGYVFLNEVYKRLGLPESYEGQVVGWFFDKEHPLESPGDDYIDFRIMNPEDPGARDFINGWNKSVWLDFNVMGPILDRMPKNRELTS